MLSPSAIFWINIVYYNIKEYKKMLNITTKSVQELISSEQKNKTAFLTGIRGLAALMVFAHHASGSGIMNFGNVGFRGIGAAGVSIFFVLSAFLLTEIIIHTGQKFFTLQSLASYSIKRVFRIFPLYTVYLLLALFSSFFFITMLSRESGIPFFIDFDGFVRHLVLQEGKGITWTIAVEFKYYLVIPVFCFFILYVDRFSLSRLLKIVMFLITMISSYILAENSDHTPLDTRLVPYLPIFLFGSWIAVLKTEIDRSNIKNNDSLSYISIFLFFISIILFFIVLPASFDFPHKQDLEMALGGKRLAPGILFGFILISCFYGPRILSRIFENKFLIFIGITSFSVYLLHMPVVKIVSSIGILNSPETGWIIASIMTLIVSYISYSFIERPFILMSRSPWRFSQVLVANKKK